MTGNQENKFGNYWVYSTELDRIIREKYKEIFKRREQEEADKKEKK